MGALCTPSRFKEVKASCSSFSYIHGAPNILKGVVVPLPSFIEIPSRKPKPEYSNIVSTSVSAGEGAINFFCIKSGSSARLQLAVLMISKSAFLIFVAAKYCASSPSVQQCLTGIFHLPINELQFASSSMGPSAKLNFPPAGLGLSKTINCF